MISRAGDVNRVFIAIFKVKTLDRIFIRILLKNNAVENVAVVEQW